MHPCFEAWRCGKPLISGPVACGAGIRPRDHANEACAGCAPSRGSLRCGRGRPVRRRRGITSAHASASSARGRLGEYDASGLRTLKERNALLLVVLVESLPDFTSHRRPLPRLTPSRLTPSGTPAAPKWYLVAPSPWWRGWSRSCDDGHVTTLAGRPYGDLGGALPRVKPTSHPLSPPLRMY